MELFRYRLGVGAVAAIVILAACGTEGNQQGPESSQVSLSTLADSSGSELQNLNQTFAGCTTDAFSDREDAVDILRKAHEWVEVLSIENVGPPLDGELPRPMVLVSTANGSTRELMMHESFIPGVEWALTEGGTVWTAVADPEAWGGLYLVEYVLAFTVDEQAFFPGECFERNLYAPLSDRYGAGLDETMRSAIGKTGADLDSALELDEPTDNGPVLLHPGDVPDSYLADLQSAVLHISLTHELGGSYRICTKIDAGWNDCFVPGGDTVRTGTVIASYVDSGGIMEVWLIDADASLDEPLLLLGNIEIPKEMIGLDVAVRLEVATDRIAHGGSSRVTVREVVELEQLDLDDPNWPALREPYRASR